MATPLFYRVHSANPHSGLIVSLAFDTLEDALRYAFSEARNGQNVEVYGCSKNISGDVVQLPLQFDDAFKWAHEKGRKIDGQMGKLKRF